MCVNPCSLLKELVEVEKFSGDGQVSIYKCFGEDQKMAIAKIVKKLNVVIENQTNIVRCIKRHKADNAIRMTMKNLPLVHPDEMDKGMNEKPKVPEKYENPVGPDARKINGLIDRVEDILGRLEKLEEGETWTPWIRAATDPKLAEHIKELASKPGKIEVVPNPPDHCCDVFRYRVKIGSIVRAWADDGWKITVNHEILTYCHACGKRPR